MKKLYLFALVAMMFAACATDDTQDLRPIDAPETLTVGFEGGDDDTRIQLQNGKTVWTKGDLVSVFYRSNANQKWQFQGDTGERTGLLKRVSTPEATITLSDVVVAYPYSEEYYINPKTCNIQAYLPATQSYLKDSFGLDGNLMVSASEYNQIYLKNVCGWLKLQLTGEGEMVQSITLKGNNGEQVAGSIYVDTETATATLAAETNGGYEDGVGGTLVFDDAILTEVVLNCGNGVELGAGATAFYIALPPQTFEKGLTIDVACSDGSTMTKSTENAIAIERNAIQPMAVFKVEIEKPETPDTPTQPTQANNEIWYTATAKVEPYFPDEFGATITSNVWDSDSGKGVITFNVNVTKISYYAFNECEKLKTITIPDSVTEIEDYAFGYCSSLTSVNIPDSVTKIGNFAFYSCSSLTSVTIPNSVTSIGEEAFGYCDSLTSVTIGNGVTSFGKGGFRACTSLTSVTIGNGVTSIREYAFWNCSSLTNITIPDSVTKIGNSAFERCTSLTSVTIGNGVTSIGKSAFERCTSLTSVTIPDSVTSIGEYAFYNCSSLKEVYCKPTTPPTGDSLYMFYYNASGRKIYVPASDDDSIINAYKAKSGWSNYKSYIYEYIFIPNNEIWYTNGSTTEATAPNKTDVFGANIVSNLYDAEKKCWVITFDGDVTKIGDDAFRECTSLTSITITDSVTSIGNSAFNACTSLTAFYGKFASEDNRCLIVNGTLNAFAIGCGATSYTIPDSVTEIGKWAFSNCTSLTSVNIPDSVTSIGQGVFGYCTSLTSVTIPDSVTKIENYAFYDCTLLTSVTIPDGVTSIGRSAFLGCTSLTSITIPDSVTSIGRSAFLGCTSLTSVTIPDSVTEIGQDAFFRCTSLKTVHCKPTTPPTGDSSMFSSNASGRRIFVPASDDDSIINAYKEANGWGKYADNIFEYDFSAEQ